VPDKLQFTSEKAAMQAAFSLIKQKKEYRNKMN
jgi:hypothetical protein